MKTRAFGAFCVIALAVAPTIAGAAEDVVKIGVLNDQTGLFADGTGHGSVVAAARVR